MLSIELIRKDPAYVHQALLKRDEAASIDIIADLDRQRRLVIQKGDGLRARRNEGSRSIAQMPEKPTGLIDGSSGAVHLGSTRDGFKSVNCRRLAPTNRVDPMPGGSSTICHLVAH